jgi:hypothetical protein
MIILLINSQKNNNQISLMFNIIWSKAKVLKLKNNLKLKKFTTLFSLGI